MTNLLPLIKKKAIAKIYRLRLTSATFLMMASVVIVAIVLLLPTFFVVETEKKSVNQQLEGLVPNGEQEEVLDTDEVIDEAQQKLSILTTGVGSYQNVSYIHEVLIGYRTDNVNFTRFSYDSQVTVDEYVGKITVNGRATDRKSLEKFVESLDRDPLFTDIDDPISNYIDEKDLSFSIIVNITNHES